LKELKARNIANAGNDIDCGAKLEFSRFQRYDPVSNPHLDQWPRLSHFRALAAGNGLGFLYCYRFLQHAEAKHSANRYGLYGQGAQQRLAASA
jgi:hypothetical protein